MLINFSSLQPEAKQKLIAALKRDGLCESATRRRFANDKFSEWERKGLRAMTREYNPNYRGSFAAFWLSLKSKEDFYHFMRSKGLSRTTVLSKFAHDGAKKWEVNGINHYLKKLKSAN